MNILERIMQLREERNWTEYRLSVESEIPQSTISSWYRKSILPSFVSLENICKAFNISISQFFAWNEKDTVELSHSEKVLLAEFSKLTPVQQEKLLDFINSLAIKKE